MSYMELLSRKDKTWWTFDIVYLVSENSEGSSRLENILHNVYLQREAR